MCRSRCCHQTCKTHLPVGADLFGSLLQPGVRIATRRRRARPRRNDALKLPQSVQANRPSGQDLPIRRTAIRMRAGGRPLSRTHPRKRTAHLLLDRIEAYRAISTGQLNALLHLHLRPIDVVVCHGPQGRPGFEGGFPLRCLQRLSCPHIATLHCRGRDNRSTSGAFTPVLSY